MSLNERDTTSYVARSIAARNRRTVGPVSLFRFLARRGGLKPHPDLAYILDGNPVIPGNGRLLRASGMMLDRAREACVEAGYLQDAGDIDATVSESTINDLIEIVRAESHGHKQYPCGEMPEPTSVDPAEYDHWLHGQPCKAKGHVMEMTGAEYSQALKKLGLSNRGFCLTIIGVNDATGRKWIAGQSPVPGSVAALLRLAIKLNLTSEQVHTLTAKGVDNGKR